MRSAPALGDEGSHMLDVSLQVLDVCSESFFLVLPSALWEFFLFLMRILPIRSTGLGRGTPTSNCTRETPEKPSKSCTNWTLADTYEPRVIILWDRMNKNASVDFKKHKYWSANAGVFKLVMLRLPALIMYHGRNCYETLGGKTRKKTQKNE